MLSSNLQKSTANDEIEFNLKDLIGIFYRGKWIITIVAVLAIIISTIVALKLPNIYKSESLLSPVDTDSSLGISGIQNQLGGLASLAGVNLGSGQSANTQLAIQILKSRYFVTEFINERDILPELMAATNWDRVKNEVVFDGDLFDVKSRTWLVDDNISQTPSLQKAFKKFQEIVAITVDDETSMISLSVEHVSPVIAKKWNTWLVEDINTSMKERDVAEAKKSTAYLTEQLKETNISDFREVLYRLIEEQAKTIMFANVRDEYVFKTIDPAIVPEEKIGPRRAIIVLLSCIFGVMLGGLIVLVRALRPIGN